MTSRRRHKFLRVFVVTLIQRKSGLLPSTSPSTTHSYHALSSYRQRVSPNRQQGLWYVAIYLFASNSLTLEPNLCIMNRYDACVGSTCLRSLSAPIA